MKHTLYLIFGILLLSAATSVYYPLTVDNTLIYDESTNSLSVDTTKLATRYYSGSLTGGGAEYLVYTALISQSGTDAPTATVLENTLGGTVVWGYTSAGQYTATLSGAFTADKTLVIAWLNDGSRTNVISVGRLNSNVINVSTYEEGVGTDELLIDGQSYIEIRVYD